MARSVGFAFPRLAHLGEGAQLVHMSRAFLKRSPASRIAVRLLGYLPRPPGARTCQRSPEEPTKPWYTIHQGPRRAMTQNLFHACAAKSPARQRPLCQKRAAQKAMFSSHGMSG